MQQLQKNIDFLEEIDSNAYKHCNKLEDAKMILNKIFLTYFLPGDSFSLDKLSFFAIKVKKGLIVWYLLTFV